MPATLCISPTPPSNVGIFRTAGDEGRPFLDIMIDLTRRLQVIRRAAPHQRGEELIHKIVAHNVVSSAISTTDPKCGNIRVTSLAIDRLQVLQVDLRGTTTADLTLQVLGAHLTRRAANAATRFMTHRMLPSAPLGEHGDDTRDATLADILALALRDTCEAMSATTDYLTHKSMRRVRRHLLSAGLAWGASAVELLPSMVDGYDVHCIEVGDTITYRGWLADFEVIDYGGVA